MGAAGKPLPEPHARSARCERRAISPAIHHPGGAAKKRRCAETQRGAQRGLVGFGKGGLLLGQGERAAPCGPALFDVMGSEGEVCFGVVGGVPDAMAPSCAAAVAALARTTRGRPTGTTQPVSDWDFSR